MGVPLVDKSVYTKSTQNIGIRYQKYLEQNNADGMMIADFRDPNRNSYVAHCIFTQKHKLGNGGDVYPSINETPTFAISNNHACLQISDLICSALITPMAMRVFCTPGITSLHNHANYDAVLQRYRKRIKALQFHCQVKGQMYWGITASPNPHNAKTIADFL